MPDAVSSSLLQVIRRAAEDGRLAAMPDQELLRHFREHADADAFHALLRRHGPMVLDVCRAVARTADAAEDAFQATFLVLVQNAGRIRKAASVASWLHGVAYRTTLKARVASARRQKREAGVPPRQPAGPDDLTWREVRCALYEELDRLAERHRAPLVLCYLQGKGQDEAAAELGLTRGTLKGRLESARALLRERLIRRGLGPAAALLAPAWPATAAVPAALVALTTNTAMRVAATSAVGGSVSAGVAALTEGVIRPALLTKSRAAVFAVVVAAAVVGGRASGLLAWGAEPPMPDTRLSLPASAGTATVADEPKAVVPEQVSVSKQHPPRFAVRLADNRWRGRCAFLDDGRILVASDIQKVPEVRDAKTGALRKAFPEVPEKTTVSGFRLSADRKWLAANTGPEIDPREFTGRLRTDNDITVWEVATGKARGTVTASSLLALAPDGRTLAVTVEGKIELRDVATGKQVKPAPFKFNAIDATAFSPDGAWLVVSGLNEIAYWKWKDGDTHERLRVGRRVQSLAFSPDSRLLAEGPDSRATIEVRDLATMKVIQTASDGKRTLGVEALAFADGGRTLVAGNANLPARKVDVPHRIHFWDVKTGEPTREIALDRDQPRSLDVSPDGKSMAVVLVHGDETILAVWDLDKVPGVPEPAGEPAPKPDEKRAPAPGGEDAVMQPLTPREAAEKHAGKEVRVVFRVASGYSIFGGSVPRGQLPPFGLVAEGAKDDPRFSVLVSGELVLILDRLGVSQLDPGKFFKGKTIEVVGKIERFDPTEGAPDGKPSYQLAVEGWKKFRIVQ